MNLLSFLKKKKTLSAVIDIQEFSITTAIAELSKEDKPKIIYCHEYTIDESEISTYKKYINSLIKALDKSLSETRRGLNKIGITDKIDRYSFFLGSPWVISQSKEIRIVKDKPFQINSDFLKKIVLEQEKTTEIELEKADSKDWEVLEEKIIQSKLNGYKVNDIFNKKTKDVEINSFVSFIPKIVKEKIDSIIRCGLTDCPEHDLHSSTISSYTFFRDLYADKNDFIFINIGKKVSDVYIVKEDVIHSSISFPAGEEYILETIAKKSKISKEIILSSLSIHKNDRIEATEKKKIAEFAKIGLTEWIKKLKNTLSKVCTNENVPSEIILLENSIFSSFFADNYSKLKGEEIPCFYSRDPHINIIKDGTLNPFISGAKIFQNRTLIKMDIIFLDKLIKNHNA